MKVRVDLGVLDVLRFAAQKGDESWTYIITGRTGSTGKTYLCGLLKQRRYHAIEISPEIFDLVEYKDDRNHFLVNAEEKYAIVVLNKLIPHPSFRTNKGENE